MNETDVKYLAGMLDADGSISFNFIRNKYLSLRVVVVSTESTDFKGRMIKSLPFGVIVKTTPNNTKWALRRDWVLTKSADLEKVLPRVTKHMVTKGKHFKRVYDTWREYKGRALTEKEIEFLRKFIKESRKYSGPVKAKKHPTWAWVAGILDGDGCYFNKYYPNKSYRMMQVTLTHHKDDRVSLDLMKKAFGGRIVAKSGNPKVLIWIRNLGFSETTFSLKFLRRVLRYSRCKRHKIEKIIHMHSQRLSDSDPTG